MKWKVAIAIQIFGIQREKLQNVILLLLLYLIIFIHVCFRLLLFGKSATQMNKSFFLIALTHDNDISFSLIKCNLWFWLIMSLSYIIKWHEFFSVHRKNRMYALWWVPMELSLSLYFFLPHFYILWSFPAIFFLPLVFFVTMSYF